MESPSENYNPSASLSPEDKIQGNFAEYQPETSSPVDIDSAVEKAFHSDVATEKIEKIFYKEIRMPIFEARIKEIVITAKKVQTYDGVEKYMRKIVEWAVVAFVGYAFPTRIWPLIKNYLSLG